MIIYGRCSSEWPEHRARKRWRIMSVILGVMISAVANLPTTTILILGVMKAGASMTCRRKATTETTTTTTTRAMLLGAAPRSRTTTIARQWTRSPSQARLHRALRRSMMIRTNPIGRAKARAKVRKVSRRRSWAKAKAAQDVWCAEASGAQHRTARSKVSDDQTSSHLTENEAHFGEGERASSESRSKEQGSIDGHASEKACAENAKARAKASDARTMALTTWRAKMSAIGVLRSTKQTTLCHSTVLDSAMILWRSLRRQQLITRKMMSAIGRQLMSACRFVV
jgi:hypothetical protein